MMARTFVILTTGCPVESLKDSLFFASAELPVNRPMAPAIDPKPSVLIMLRRLRMFSGFSMSR